VEVLDEIRRFLSAGLGFSRADRHTNVQRIGLVSEVLAQRRPVRRPGDRPVPTAARPSAHGITRAGHRT